MSTQMEIDSGSEQLTNQMHHHLHLHLHLHPHHCSLPGRLCPSTTFSTGIRQCFKFCHTAITSKLRSDAAFIGNHEQQRVFVNGMLSMKVRRRVAPEHNNGPAVNYNPAHFLEYLGLIYNDSKAADRARNELECDLSFEVIAVCQNLNIASSPSKIWLKGKAFWAGSSGTDAGVGVDAGGGVVGRLRSRPERVGSHQAETKGAVRRVPHAI
ncbi:hypothetical protein E4U50_000592 [Claviceps purpurea]|nr:hypothetical protein E4U50_000592 [Claviceps purpurea]